MIVRDKVREAVEEIVEVADGWKHAYDEWQRAVKARDRLSERMARRIARATGGLSVARWEALCRRRRARTVEDAKGKARAIRAKPAVEAAVAERDRLLAAENAKMLAARIELTHASKTMARYGTLGLDMIDQSAIDLRRFSRRPPTT
ncbi:MAG: hypothetical protein ACYCU5_02970 [Actinomycetes bacterium]